MRSILAFIALTAVEVFLVLSPDITRIATNIAGERGPVLQLAVVALVYGVLILLLFRNRTPKQSVENRQPSMEYQKLAETIRSNTASNNAVLEQIKALRTDGVKAQPAELTSQNLGAITAVMEKASLLEPERVDRALTAFKRIGSLLDAAQEAAKDEEGDDRDFGNIEEVLEVAQKLSELAGQLPPNIERTEAVITSIGEIASQVSAICEEYNLDDLKERLEEIREVAAAAGKLVAKAAA